MQTTSLTLQKPLFVGEFGLPLTAGSESGRLQFAALVAALETSKVPLSALWVFDYSGQDKDWNVTFENQRSYMLKEISQANQRMQR